jgi:uncharacterized protein (TIGR00106 family)
MLAQFSIVPLGKSKGLSENVASIIEMVEESGLDYRLTPMATVVEGEFEVVMALIMDCHKLARKSSSRVITTITIDDHEGAEGRISGKVQDVEKKLGREVKK